MRINEQMFNLKIKKMKKLVMTCTAILGLMVISCEDPVTPDTTDNPTIDTTDVVDVIDQVDTTITVDIEIDTTNVVELSPGTE